MAVAVETPLPFRSIEGETTDIEIDLVMVYGC